MTVVAAGKNLAVQRLFDAGTTIAIFNYGQIGTGTTAPTSADTTLETPVGTRVQDVNASPDPPSPTGAQSLVFTFAAGNGSGAITEFGLFNASSGGTMVLRKIFPPITKDATTAITVTITTTVS